MKVPIVVSTISHKQLEQLVDQSVATKVVDYNFLFSTSRD